MGTERRGLRTSRGVLFRAPTFLDYAGVQRCNLRVSELLLLAAIVREAKRQNITLSPVTDFTSAAGLGVSGVVDGRRVRVGRERYLEASMCDYEDDEDGTTLWVTRDDQCVGAITLDDTLRPSAAAAVRELKALGVDRVHLLSGDRNKAVARLAADVGIDSWAGELLPNDKLDRLHSMRHDGRKVMYVGDAVNDGPALATSYVGVAMGAAASPLALETADIAILRPDVSQVPALIRLGRVTKRRIRENLLAFAVLYNGIAIALASFGVLSPIMAALTHNVGSVAVVLNSARLIRWNP